MKLKLLFTTAFIITCCAAFISGCGSSCPTDSDVIGKPGACVDACMADGPTLCGTDPTCRNRLLECHRLTKCQFDAIVIPTSAGGYNKRYNKSTILSLISIYRLDCITKDELGIEASDATSTIRLIPIDNTGDPHPRFTLHGYSIPFIQQLFSVYTAKDGIFTVYKANKRDVPAGPLVVTFALKYSDIGGTVYYLGDMTEVLPAYFVK